MTFITNYKIHNFWPILTVSGIVVFVLLYFLAAYYYPGGSNFDAHQVGFRWSTNYWCELLGFNAKNGEYNTARPIGLSGMVILSISISFFWFYIPTLIPQKKWMNTLLSFSGIMSMLCSAFIFSHFHDLFIYLAVIFGTIAFGLTLNGLQKNQMTFYYIFGVSCLILILINNAIYLTDFLILYLPWIQKITFFVVFLWISLLSLKSLNENKQH